MTLENKPHRLWFAHHTGRYIRSQLMLNALFNISGKLLAECQSSSLIHSKPKTDFLQGEPMVERRKHKRYSMPHGTFVILRNKIDPLRNHTKMSIGEIAMVLYKSEPEAMGQVTNLSVGGIAFGGKTIGLPVAGSVQLDLLMTEQGIYVHNIPYAVVPIRTNGKRKKKVPAFRTNALRFKHLDVEKKGQLRELLAHCVGQSSAMGHYLET